MKAKRFLLMMLVMLMSVTGVWAQNNVIRYTATSKVEPFNKNVFGANLTSHVYNGTTKEGVMTFDGDVTTIGQQAFYTKSALTSIDIPNSVTSIGLYSFVGCSSLVSIIIPVGVTSIGEGAFLGCSSLTSIIIPAGVTSIGKQAFDKCSSLTSVDIPGEVTQFGEFCFKECKSLKRVTINSQQTLNAAGYYINSDGSFDGDGILGSRNFGNQVEEYILKGNITTIPKSKFSNTSIKKIIIPATVTLIENSAFKYCEQLESITSLSINPPTLRSGCFQNVTKSIPVYVPSGTTAAYQAAEGWNEFTNFVEITPNKLLLVSSNTSLGKVYGTGIYDTATEITIHAVPKAGCKFTGWSDGNTENPRQYVVTSDAKLTANFEAENVFQDPTSAGMRLRVKKSDGKTYEFSTSELKKVDYYRSTKVSE